MAFELSRESGIPLYIQIKEQIRKQIEENAWQPGFKLPTERQLASLLGVSRNTVSMAYQVTSRRGVDFLPRKRYFRGGSGYRTFNRRP